jgi:glycosyltransferase involved in cell wall biosynthesis
MISSDKIRKPRVRVGRNYAITFNILHGQRNARLISGPTNPLQKISRHLASISITEPGYDLIHTFNSIPILTRCPFVITFESLMPRIPSEPLNFLLLSYLRNRLLSPQCLALIAMSEYAVRQMRHQHRDFPGLAGLIDKTRLIYPGVQLTRRTPKKANARPTLLFVGNDFFRKGGPALVRAHKILRSSGIDAQTTIVSSLAWSAEDYIGPPDPVGIEAAKKELMTAGVTYHRSLPNKDVRQLMEAADFLVLPTFHDTFGYVAIEAMAAGTPVISTATCAQPEIVEDNESGFLLDFENEPDVGKWTWISRVKPPGYTDAYWSTIDTLAESIVSKIAEVDDSRYDYERLSAGAIARVADRFNSELARDRLEEIYRRLPRKE